MGYNLSAINTNSAEGRLLFAALSIITTESRRDETPDQVLADTVELADKMYKDAIPSGSLIDGIPPPPERTFEQELTTLINKKSLESGSHTPDYILARFLNGVLQSYNAAVSERDKWHGIDPWHYTPSEKENEPQTESNAEAV